jgi:ferrous iron transport protein B
MSSSLVRLGRRDRTETSEHGRVLFLGNPNTGKTTLFNRLAGTNLRVGNYPGVTVEMTTARVDLGGRGTAEIVDLPGTYSICGRSAEERIAIDALLGVSAPVPDCIVLVGDATQLRRSLYLTLQVAELAVPIILALNMADEIDALGVDLDVAGLAKRLGIPVVAVSARTGQGIADLLARLAFVLEDPSRGRSEYRTEIGDRLEAAAIEAGGLVDGWLAVDDDRRRALGLWALMSVDPTDDEEGAPADVAASVVTLRNSLERDGVDLDAVITSARYATIDALLGELLVMPDGARARTDKIDRILVHPIWGFGSFLILMTLLFQGLFSWSDPAIGLIETLVGAVGDGAVAVLPDGLFEDFVVGGLIAGVGAVIVFLPQILLLFLLIGLMEDSGYMARVAYLMDRIMKAVGLHGRAFVPLLSGFACAVPAVLATRTMERKRDRLLTMLVVPLTTCSARLPVYTLLIAALLPATFGEGGWPVQGLVLAAMYLLSIVTALLAAAVLGRTLLKGGREPLLLELPPYRLPRAATVVRMMWDRSKVFLTDAGTVILACTVVLWFLLTFPLVDPADVPAGMSPDTYALEQSYAANMGKALEPVIEPLGYDWKIGVGLIGSFAAREVFVATMGVVYGVGADVDEDSDSLRDRIRESRRPDGTLVYTPLVGLSLMVFFAFAAQCMSTLAAVKRETGGYKWPVFMVVYMTALAWVASFAVYQGGLLLGFG